MAEVRPTKSVAQPPAPPAASTVERRKSVGTNLKKRSSEMGPNFTPFNDPQRALHLVSTQINSPEWYDLFIPTDATYLNVQLWMLVEGSIGAYSS